MVQVITYPQSAVSYELVVPGKEDTTDHPFVLLLNILYHQVPFLILVYPVLFLLTTLHYLTSHTPPHIGAFCGLSSKVWDYLSQIFIFDVSANKSYFSIIM